MIKPLLNFHRGSQGGTTLKLGVKQGNTAADTSDGVAEVQTCTDRQTAPQTYRLSTHGSYRNLFLYILRNVSIN